jgi:hypothetical protein
VAVLGQLAHLVDPLQVTNDTLSDLTSQVNSSVIDWTGSPPRRTARTTTQDRTDIGFLPDGVLNQLRLPSAAVPAGQHDRHVISPPAGLLGAGHSTKTLSVMKLSRSVLRGRLLAYTPHRSVSFVTTAFASMT